MKVDRENLPALCILLAVLASVDGLPRETAMFTPGFVGVPVPAGRHSLLFRYDPETGSCGWRWWVRSQCC
jgi:hypothetical protein